MKLQYRNIFYKMFKILIQKKKLIKMVEKLLSILKIWKWILILKEMKNQ